MSEMSQKTFFLESAKKNLTDKVMTLQASLKVARELKDRAASERVQKMEKENLALQVSVIVLGVLIGLVLRLSLEEEIYMHGACNGVCPMS